MDTEKFCEWLLKLENFHRKRKRLMLLLLLEKFECHEVSLELSQVGIPFLPPKTTSLSRPIAQGSSIIRTRKNW